MSFRGRLRVFFTTIVILPMIALAVILLRLAAESETGKADAGISTAVTTALSVYEQAERDARGALRRVASDRRLRVAVTGGNRKGATLRVHELQRLEPGVASIVLGGPG